MIDPSRDQAIRKKASLILSQCRQEKTLYRWRSHPIVTMGFCEEPEVLSLEELAFVELASEQVDLLRALFQAADDAGRHIVAQECAVALRFPQTSAQAFVFLARCYSFRLAIKSVLATFGVFATALHALSALTHLLHCDHSFISDVDLASVSVELKKGLKAAERTLPSGAPTASDRIGFTGNTRDRFNQMQSSVNYIRSQVSKVQYLRLKKQLMESANFEINQDRDRLLEHLGALGFSAKLTEFLKFAEVEFAKAQDAFSYKTCIDQIRSFFAELLTETAEKVAASRGDTLKKVGVDPKYPAQVREYLERTGFFSEQFKTLVTGLYRFMSDAGTHTLGATKDVGRIARNIAIEIGLLITKRVEEFNPSSTP